MTAFKTQFSHLPFGEDLLRSLSGSGRWSLSGAEGHEQNTAAYLSPYTFSGKERDVETNLSYFGARYYESSLSMWLSVDPMSDKYPYQSVFTYCGWNPLTIIYPDGRDEIELTKQKGELKHVLNNRFYRDQNGNVTTDYAEGMIEVDRVFDSRGKEIYVKHGTLQKAMRNPSVHEKLRFYEFNDDSEAAIFFEFAARGSDVEWGYARQRGSAPSYVGTNEGEGHSIFGSFMEHIFGENLIQLMHSHPNAGGPPSVNIMGPNNTKVGDLNAAFLSKYPSLLRKVFDPNENMTYSYDGTTLNLGRRYIDSWKGFKP